MSALSDPKSLMPSITLASYTIPAFSVLVDSGSSDYFIDMNFVNKHSLSAYPVPPLKLHLFDRIMNSTITRAITLSPRFETSDIILTSFYVTPLDGSCSLVLGHNWLTHNNPLIDWAMSSISFHSPEQSVPANLCASLQPLTPLLSVEPPTSDPPCFSDCKAPHIALVSTPAFTLACRLKGSVQYSMQLCPLESDLCSASTIPELTDLSGVPPDYHNFADIFSKSKADTLAPHREHDLKISLEDGASPPLGATYSLCSSKLSSLREFLDEHLTMGFIHPSSSVHAAPVLFVHKKDGSLHLCIDF